MFISSGIKSTKNFRSHSNWSASNERTMECRTSDQRHAPGAKIANSNESATFDREHIRWWLGYDFIMIYIRAETTRCADGRGRPTDRPLTSSLIERPCPAAGIRTFPPQISSGSHYLSAKFHNHIDLGLGLDWGGGQGWGWD